ncbi:Long-chain fatty acid transport protein 4 [Papilio machaon]|uniref:long-chain-fatty-acid--CoA ligase n=1 Tax=Papilio machaon TaxID=76193 RepID=A0A194R2E2_PAPMA|nr:Long-chain fatty acid transport protein 4 [Papilio machaon]
MHLCCKPFLSEGRSKNVIENKQSGDVEKGRIEYLTSSVPWSKVMVIVVAMCVLVAACATTWIFQDWQTSIQVFAIIFVVYVILFYWRWLWVALRTAKRDFSALYCYLKILSLTRSFSKKNFSMPEIFHNVVLRHPDKACFLYEDETWTFKQIEDFSLKVSAALKSKGVKRGDTVAVMAGNYPEMPAMWLGVARLGAIAPLINTNQTGNTLLHSINVAKCNFVIYCSEFDDAFQEIKKELDPSIKLLKFTRRPLNVSSDSVKVVEDSNDFTGLLENTTPAAWSPSDSDGFNGKLLYIYTSGTTGLPKAAVISPSRMVFMASGVHYLGGLSPKDVIYCPMPLYHSAGGCITVGQAFIFGCTVALRNKFSASAYFPDCIKFNATAAHYIGEMCRYILATPPKPTDKQHKVRTVYGNGMRPTVWTDFVNRFNIKRVVEFYGATEGNANIGDILIADELGYLYFRDRTGDTFRWRGENVSTTEVEAAISRIADQRDAVVYGVEIPNTEGRAGMCGIVDTDGSLDLERLVKDMARDLPKYARPVFLRVMDSLDMTGTFKLKKVDLQKEGYDPTIIKDKIYYLDTKSEKYISLGPDEYEKIKTGQIRL